MTDFGLAKFAGDPEGTATHSRCPLGTPAYMSPEQAAGNVADVGPPSDVYAPGAMLYELLAGDRVFHGATDLETLHKVLVEDPVPLRRMRRDVSADIEAICLKCLEKKPQDRYPSWRGLGGRLAAIHYRQAHAARPLSSVHRAVRWAGPTAALRRFGRW